MATNPRIQYDVVANAQGEQDVARLATALEKVDDAIDPVAAKRAQELAAELKQLGAQQAAIDRFVQLRQAADGARAELDRLQAEAQAAGRAIAQTEAPTRAQTGQLEKLRDAVRAAKSELQSQTAALDQSRAALGRLGISSDEVASAQLRVKQQTNAAAQAAQELQQRYTQTAAAAEASASTQVAAQKRVADSVAGIGAQLSRLQGLAAAALGGSFVGQLAGDVAKVADEYNNLAARIKLVTGQGPAFEQAFGAVFEIATRTGTAIEATGNLFARVLQSGKAIGLQQADALALTESINQAIQLSGAAAEASDAAITQLLQGLQSGVLRGEEFNSVLEQSPRLAQALADGLGVTTGELRKLANQGALTSEVVIKALQGQSATLQREFEQLPPTVGRALQNISTEWTRYVGEVDKANGISETAAKAIKLVGDNIGFLVTSLKLAGEGWVAYKALDLAGVLLRQVAGTKASTAAVQEETAALTANTAQRRAAGAASAVLEAQLAREAAAARANAAAQTTAAQALLPTAAKGAEVVGLVGRLAGTLGLVYTAYLAIKDIGGTVFSSVGTSIGEAVAKLQGYKDRSDEILANQKAVEDALRKAAAETAALAQQYQNAADKALGLNDASKAIVAEFTQVEQKGGSTADALEKVRKALDLGDIKGIADAGAALDVLALKGKLSADQIREAFASALNGKDLAIFEAQARAAFDTSEQGARRLKVALDAIGEEALRRAGSSLQELASGFSEAAQSAINDVDALVATLEKVGGRAEDTGRILAGALNKATSAASTERAVQAVIDRLQELARQGKITGEQLAAGLELARKKIDELKPGINSLDEALRAFGLKTRTELQTTATTLGEAYRRIANDVTVSLQDKAKAFEQYAAAATAANGGVETAEVKLQRAILDTKLAAAGLGTTITSSMKDAAKATDLAAEAQKRYNDLLQADPGRLAGGSGLGGIGGGGDTPGAPGTPGSAGGSGGAASSSKPGGLTLDSGLVIGKGSTLSGNFWNDNRVLFAPGSPQLALSPMGLTTTPGQLAALGGTIARPAPSPALAAPAPAKAPPAQPTSTKTIEIKIGGATRSLTFADQNSADAFMRLIEEDFRALGLTVGS